MSDALDDQRGSEVEDYTGQIPRVEHHDHTVAPSGQQPSGFGDGDVADVDDDEISAPVAGMPDTADTADTAAMAVEGVDVDALLAERDQYKDVAMRLQADFENFRKRIASQGADDVDRATGRLAEAFLPVLDAAEAAYVRHPDEVGPLLNVMLAELKKHGLETLDLEAQPFDPEVAEAVAHESGDGGDVVVAEVMRSGYRWRGKTLRPAMVRTRD
ncbi:MAG: nucleotide exchange factor GrpE [Ilumatobacter sp.]|uniref:nucleotide exchange factor GrpE n=1 Tax=Ilumatobacter sp. TaxID=1967498 RepID=UPI0026282032|nr:nucleotide exchange factor GrpE [Ilumatobacter sp.]MDJ0769513.1 nucleotide exchange factor GrpE [Ilumatobacter sp.]